MDMKAGRPENRIAPFFLLHFFEKPAIITFRNA